ncbi:hypothetical protein DJ93_1510 [Bacillus clarus]|uniref:Uncharacterized protein n=1 Tax=Bacillus clarus TaxID=2338372 RepID=A0A090YUI3_9BACI|nr:hypothetical protein DJ93_1510 [Bacillus clarus]
MEKVFCESSQLVLKHGKARIYSTNLDFRGE